LPESQLEILPQTSTPIEDDTGSCTAIEEVFDHDVAKEMNEHSTDAITRSPDERNMEHSNDNDEKDRCDKNSTDTVARSPDEGNKETPTDDEKKDRDDKTSTDTVERHPEGEDGEELNDDGQNDDGESDDSRSSDGESNNDGSDDDGSDYYGSDYEDAAANYLPKAWWSVFDDWEPKETHASADKEKEDIAFTYMELEYLDDKVDSIPDSSPSRLEWLHQKQKLKKPLDRKKRHLLKVLDRVMCLGGHEDVKKQFLSIKARIEAGKARHEDLIALKPNLLILGGPETGTYTTPSERNWFTYKSVI
jgi:hypothetical protein